MSYLKDLDEYTTAELEAELASREVCRNRGVCDYCRRSPNTPPCRFPDRHAGGVGRHGLKWLLINGHIKWVPEAFMSHEQLIACIGYRGDRPTMTCHYPSTGKTCTVLPREYVKVREGMRVDIANTGAA